MEVSYFSDCNVIENEKIEQDRIEQLGGNESRSETAKDSSLLQNRRCVGERRSDQQVGRPDCQGQGILHCKRSSALTHQSY